MRILIFNWRDIKNPAAGGAEVFTHEIARRLVKKGRQVTLLTSRFDGCDNKETIDGIEVIRVGGRYTVYWEAIKYYLKKLKGKYDVVIDEINTLPFFTPFFVKEPIIMLIHQLCKEVWFYEIKFPFSLIGYFFESFYLRLYKRKLCITVSESTRDDLWNLGFKEVKIVRDAIDFLPLSFVPQKEGKATLIYVGRLKKSKGVHKLIEAVSAVKKDMPNIQLWIVGDGDKDYKRMLYDIVEKKGLSDNVTFFGYVDKAKKIELLKKSHALLLGSVREGWGIVVIEANACGTPAIAFDVAGLRDAIVDGETGMLVSNFDGMVKCINRFLADSELRKKLSENALKHAKKFSWDKSAEEFFKVIEGVVNEC